MTLTSPATMAGKGAGRPIRRTLRGDLLRAVPDAAAALLLSGLVYAIQASRVRSGLDTALQEMPAMLTSGGIWPYSLSQAVGWAALAWSWLTILLGVSLPIWTGLGRPRMREIMERLHRSTSLTVIALMIAHAVLLTWDRMGDSLITVFVPWMASYTPGLFPQTLGILSFYLAVFLGLSFYLRDRLGPRSWRLTHRYLIPAVYVLAVWHTFLYGSDLQDHNALWTALWMFQIPIVGAFAIRLLILLRRS
jgi:methionine sulfoxide reductase heme-binding subunit